MKTVLGIIGGSGIYDLPGLSNSEWRRIESPWGEPSDAVEFAIVTTKERRNPALLGKLDAIAGRVLSEPA